MFIWCTLHNTQRKCVHCTQINILIKSRNIFQLLLMVVIVCCYCDIVKTGFVYSTWVILSFSFIINAILLLHNKHFRHLPFFLFLSLLYSPFVACCKWPDPYYIQISNNNDARRSRPLLWIVSSKFDLVCCSIV